MNIKTILQHFCISTVLVIAHNEDCNPLGCFHWFNVLYDSDSYLETCIRFQKLENCLNSCSFPLNEESSAIFKKGMPNLVGALCESGLEGTEEMRKCYNEYKFRFMSCAHAALNLKPLISSTASHLTCKKIFEAEDCPNVILETCTKAARNEASELLTKFVELIRKDVCRNLSLADLIEFAVQKDEREMKYYQRLAKCMDLNHEAIAACIPQKLTINFHVTSHYKTEICNGVVSFASCAADVISTRCDKWSADAFKELLSFLRTSVLQFCIDTKPKGTKVTSSTVLPDIVHLVKSHNTDVEEQGALSDAGAGLHSMKQSVTQTQNHSNHSVSEIGLYIIHISPKIADHGHDTAASKNSCIQVVILLVLINLLVE